MRLRARFILAGVAAAIGGAALFAILGLRPLRMSSNLDAERWFAVSEIAQAHETCADDPEHWSFSRAGTEAYAYGSDGRSRNLSAPALPSWIPNRLRQTSIVQHIAEERRVFVFRVDHSECGIVGVHSYPLPVLRRTVGATLFLAPVLSAALGLFLIGWLVLRPLGQRVRRLRKAALQVGGDEFRALPAADDDLGTISRALADAHERLVEEAAGKRVQQERERAFFRDVAHDLRTPLASLRIRLENASEAPLAEGRAQIEAALADAVYLTSLVDNLRVGARLASLEDEERFDLAEVVEAVARRLAPFAERSDKHFGYSRPDEPVWVQGYRSGAEQLVANLVENAIVHGGDQIALTLAADETEFWMEVCDDGSGTEVPFAELLGRGVQGPEGAARHPAGSGLGLAIVLAACEGAGWGLDATQDDGFRITVSGRVEAQIGGAISRRSSPPGTM
ncbi:MAG: HAMP domain-containing sensor histidine kinase [Myxococcota bacterium]